MGIFNDWLAERTTNEAFNGSPDEQVPQPQRSVSNTPQNVADMEKAYYLRELKDINKYGRKASLSKLSLEKLLEPLMRKNPQIAEHWRWMSGGPNYLRINKLIAAMEQPSLSQRMRDKQGLAPPPSSN